MVKRLAVKQQPRRGVLKHNKQEYAQPTSVRQLCQQLIVEGLLSKEGIPQRMDEFVPFDPIEAKGKPASEIIIEDRGEI